MLLFEFSTGRLTHLQLKCSSAIRDKFGSAVSSWEDMTKERRMLLPAMPFCHLGLNCTKPQNNSYLWKTGLYPAHPRHLGEHIKKRRFDLKMTAIECQKLLGVDKSTLTKWEQGKHRPSREHRVGIIRFLGYEPNAKREPPRNSRAKPAV